MLFGEIGMLIISARISAAFFVLAAAIILGDLVLSAFTHLAVAATSRAVVGTE